MSDSRVPPSQLPNPKTEREIAQYQLICKKWEAASKNFDDTARIFGTGASNTIGEHICPQCVANGRANWTSNKIFCDDCIKMRESFGFWNEPVERPRKKKCATVGCRKPVEGRKRYCDKCSRRRKADSSRKSKYLKGGKLAVSPLRAEPVTKAKSAIRCGDTPTRVFLPK